LSPAGGCNCSEKDCAERCRGECLHGALHGLLVQAPALERRSPLFGLEVVKALSFTFRQRMRPRR
jgi:hypothetical protein